VRMRSSHCVYCVSVSVFARKDIDAVIGKVGRDGRELLTLRLSVWKVVVWFEEVGARCWIDSGRPGEIVVFVAEY
jgi:hypothetical protein